MCRDQSGWDGIRCGRGPGAKRSAGGGLAWVPLTGGVGAARPRIVRVQGRFANHHYQLHVRKHYD
jgi:hypothetical protein